MIALSEDDLVCDLAETYHIYDHKQLPARRVAVLASGLREDSRIKMRMSGQRYDTRTMMLAAVVDRLSLLWWAKTKDAEKGKNRPAMLYDMMAGNGNKSNGDLATFKSPEDFEKWRASMLSE